MKNYSNSPLNLKSYSNSNLEINNRLALQCSSLINEIKRKNSALLLPLYINNKKIYIQNKLSKNKFFYSDYKSNIKKLISRNDNKRYLSKNYSTDNINSKEIKSVNNISLGSLYNLPKLKSKDRILHAKGYSFHNYILNKKPQQEELRRHIKSKNSNILGIENFMKEKFYSDTENKLKQIIKTKYFRNDIMIKDKIIFLKKFGVFWRRFIQYCSPIINSKKYQLDYNNKIANNNFINSQNNNNIKKNNSLNSNKDLLLPNINSL